MIRLKNVILRLGERTLRFNDELVFPTGSITFIKGESGAGKTTLLYILGMLSNQNDYQYYFNGNLVDKQKQKEIIRKNEIGMLYQNFNVMEDLTLYQNLKLFADMNSNELTEDKAKALLKRFNLSLELNRMFKSLSGGEKQRFSLACVLLKNPSVIIADEPTSALDKGNADQLMKLLFDLAKENHKTIIISTHSKEYDGMSDNIITLYRDNVTQTSKQFSDENIRKVKRKKLNIHYYFDMIRYRLIRHLKHSRIVTILMILMLSLSTFLLNYASSSEEEYMYYLNRSLQNEIFMTPTQENEMLSDEQIEKIKIIPNIIDVYPVQKVYSELVVDDENLGIVEVFPVYAFQDQINQDKCIVDNTLLKYLDQKVQLIIKGEKIELTVDDVYSLDRTKMFSETTEGKIFIPVEATSIFDDVATNKYVLEVKNIFEFDNTSQKMNAIASGYRLESSYQYFFNLLLNARNQQIFINFVSVLLVITSGILFTTVTLHEVRDKQKEMCIFQANGLNKMHVFKLELIEHLIKLMLYFVCGIGLSIILVQVANQFILKDIVMTIGFDYCQVLLILLITMFIIPGIVSSFYLLRKSPENVLRSLF